MSAKLIKHNLDDFRETPSLPGISKVDFQNAVVEPVDLANLGIPIPPPLKSLIETGDDKDNPIGSDNAKYESRSEANWAVVTGLARLGVETASIAGVCINPSYGVSIRYLENTQYKQLALREATKAMLVVQTDWLDVYKSGQPRATLRNAYAGILRLGIACSYDEFKNRMHVGDLPLQESIGELSDKTITILRKVFIDHHGFDPFKENLRDGVETLALENSYHPMKRYFESLEWDGKSRIRKFLTTYMEAEDTELNQAIAFLFFVAAVRRIKQPGCKFDVMIVLEGPQGSGKSTILNILAGEEYFSDQDIIAADSKTQMELMEGIWLYEIGELSGLKHTDINKIKSFLSRAVDRGRPAYGRYKQNWPRQSIFIGTTNDDKYLKDQTGNRRFLPVKTGVIDLIAAKDDRDQLWAEAVYWEAKGVSINLPEELWAAAAREQEARMQDDPWVDLLSTMHGTKIGDVERVFSKDLMGHLEIPATQQQHYLTARIANCMRKIGWNGPKKIRIDKKSLRGFERPIQDDEA